jgi:calcineurin-like phosphoesterase family protein
MDEVISGCSRIINETLEIRDLSVPAPYTVQSEISGSQLGFQPGSRYWIIGDTHFGHSAIQKHTRRPANVDAIIKRNWKQLVRPQDIVIHLGDLCFGFVKVKEWMDDLPGIKILVRGNHDPKTVSYYMANGFSVACDGILIGTTYYTHEPVKHLPEGAIINIHGHCHNTRPRGLRVYPHCRLFALEYENYSPQIISKFMASIEKETPFVPNKSLDFLRKYVVRLKAWKDERWGWPL